MSLPCGDLKLKEVASAVIDKLSGDLYQLGNEIWHNPELGGEEFKAHSILTSFLVAQGFRVDRQYTGITTAFRATFGSGRPNVCVICEYDALPSIGHACGHNLIAEAGIAAGLGLKAALESSDTIKGTVTIMGTPSEEIIGGKVDLIKNGAFKDIDVAMMFHPAPYNVLKPSELIACAEWKVKYTGKAAHASAYPWMGVNALDAAVMAYNALSVYRQQMKPQHSIHGVITDGGERPNVIPEKSELHYYIRAPTIAETRQLMKKCQDCFEGAALATGCTVEFVEEGNVYYDVQSNDILAKLFSKNASNLGLEMAETGGSLGSTDMGNVSYEVPSIHPMIKIGTGEIYHTRAFTGIQIYPRFMATNQLL